MPANSAAIAAESQETKTVCPRCGWEEAVLTDKSGLDRWLASHYHKMGFGLMEVCMCVDARQLTILFNNLLRRARGVKRRDRFLVCPECAFWQIMD